MLTVSNTVWCYLKFAKKVDLKCVNRYTTQPCEAMDMLTNLIIVTSQCKQISKHSTVHLKHIRIFTDLNK